MPRAQLLHAALGLSVLLACAGPGSFVNQVYRRGAVAYRVGPLPAAWERVSVGRLNLVFRHREGGTLAVNATCPHREDAPLHVLTNHLLFGIEAQREKSRTPITLDGRAGLRTRLTGELDGVPIEMELVVLKKDGCAYDLQLVTSPQRFAARQPDFDGFLRGFTTSVSAGAADQ
jgi:hypothetical protein